MNKTKIEWCDYTWNPVVGCKRGCKFGTIKVSCYAKKMNDRFKWIPDFTELKYYPERLYEPAKIKKPSKIFVGSMSDPCYWTSEWFYDITKVCEDNPQHTFMFLSKGSCPYWGRYFPNNVILGVTLTCENYHVDNKIFTNYLSHHRRGFVSIEPLLGRLLFSKLAFSNSTEKVIVGAMTGPGAIKPKSEWIQSIKDNVPEKKIFWKNNIKRYL